MQFQLVRSIARELHLRNLNEDETADDMPDVKFRTLFSDAETRGFGVEFRVSLPIDDGKWLSATYLSLFETDEDINEEFRKSHYSQKNAPAIAFPFLRSYVAHITLLAGYEPVILATTNFKTDTHKSTASPDIFVNEQQP